MILNHNVVNLKMFLILSMFLLLLAPSTADALSASLAKSLQDWFPRKGVIIRNDATHNVILKCDAKEFDMKIKLLPPGTEERFEFLEIIFPLRWCYVQIDDKIHGLFWAYATKLKCNTACSWSIRDTGIFMYNDDMRSWTPSPLFN
ncbi:hypothetical protein HS088_TW15G00549 [Tripterygium wilfordii]|uniref:S-protein homolog n=1 Tax=Tripterygium wilfordii TaxID=458696 RepID=A0A7J7CLW2_TRIWF|nr:hypothetical protein HS088_TW15G00549 [Tripterygium wilfordii]